MSRCKIKLTVGPSYINQPNWMWNVMHFIAEVDEFFDTDSSDHLYVDKIDITFDTKHKARFTEFMLVAPIADFNLKISNVEILEMPS